MSGDGPEQPHAGEVKVAPGPLVSVVVPVFGVEEVFDRCVASILGQSYRRIEVILVDDGSPDFCPRMCDDYAAQDERVRVIHQENRGLSAARNAGIDSATGDYLTFVDADDWVHQDYVTTLLEACRMTTEAVSVCSFVRTSATVCDPPEVNEPPTGVDVLTSAQVMKQMSGRRSIELAVAWGKMIPRGLIQGIRFPVGRGHEDEATTYKLLARASAVVFVDRVLYYYWIHEQSFMRTVAPQLPAQRDLATALSERCDFLRAAGYEGAVAGTQLRLAYQYMSLLRQAQRVGALPAVRFERWRALRLAGEMRGVSRRFMKARAMLLCYVLWPGAAHRLRARLRSSTMLTGRRRATSKEASDA
jgi:hypothetical protein